MAFDPIATIPGASLIATSSRISARLSIPLLRLESCITTTLTPICVNSDWCKLDPTSLSGVPPTIGDRMKGNRRYLDLPGSANMAVCV